jgi:hypothetical protein
MLLLLLLLLIGMIKGVATFKFLPVFAQMVGGLHTELGLFGGQQLVREHFLLKKCCFLNIVLWFFANIEMLLLLLLI